MKGQWRLMIQVVGVSVMVTGMGLAQDGTRRGSAKQDAVKETGASDADQVARLQAQWQRATAALAVARQADEPDSARIEKLTRRVEARQTELQKLGVDPQVDGPWGPGQCPFGFEPLGPGPRAGWGGGGGNCPWGNVAPLDEQTPGQGRGPAGPGMGRGPGNGRGPGMGRGPGGGGAGGGWGRGGGGYGRGAGGARAGAAECDANVPFQVRNSIPS